MLKKTIFFLVFLVVGICVFTFGGYLKGFTETTRSIIKSANLVILAGITLICYRRQGWKQYYPIALAFTLSALGFWLAWLFRDWPLTLFNLAMDTPRGWAIAKVGEAIPLVLPALVLVPIIGDGYAGIYLQRGRLGLSLLLGLGMCALVGLVYGLTSDVGPKIASMLPVLGWLLLFSVSNAFMEELLLRGLFLRKFEAYFPPFTALLLSTLTFTAMHFGASYLSSDNLFMLLSFIFLLGLGNGAIMQRSDSIWGAVLAHTLADVLLLVSIFGVA